MRLDPLIRRRFSELEELMAQFEETVKQGPLTKSQIGQAFNRWASGFMSLLQRVFGEESAHYQNFRHEYEQLGSRRFSYGSCTGIFLAAKDDYEGGYLFNVRGLVKAEVLDDALEQATELLNAGYKDPACVVVGISLEVTIKELCDRVGIPHGKLDGMNVELCKAGAYNMAKQKQITAWADLRNKAAHGQWSEYTEDDVRLFLAGVRQFMADYL